MGKHALVPVLMFAYIHNRKNLTALSCAMKMCLHSQLLTPGVHAQRGLQ